MSDLMELLHLEEIAANTGRTVLVIVGLFIPIWYLERRRGSDTSRYFGRYFAHDLAYTFFYHSGAIGVLGASLIWSAVQQGLGFMQAGLLTGLPIIIAGMIWWVVNDFLRYWVHRAQHAIPFMWQFHSIHHATEQLTFLSTYRLHPVERVISGTIFIVPMLLLGIPPTMWFPLVLCEAFFEAVQHADLDWRYGRLYPVFVSPVFHRLHHSRDRRDHDQNYAKALSFWDYLFGTASQSRVPPAAVGVDGLPSEPTLVGQLLGPFRRLVRSPFLSGRPVDQPAGRRRAVPLDVQETRSARAESHRVMTE